MVFVLGLAILAYVWAFWLRRWSGGAPRLVRVLPEVIVAVALLSMLGMLVGQHMVVQDFVLARERLPVGAPVPDDITERGVTMGQLFVTAGLLAMLAAHCVLVALTCAAASRRGKAMEEEAPPEE